MPPSPDTCRRGLSTGTLPLNFDSLAMTHSLRSIPLCRAAILEANHISYYSELGPATSALEGGTRCRQVWEYIVAPNW